MISVPLLIFLLLLHYCTATVNEQGEGERGGDHCSWSIGYDSTIQEGEGILIFTLPYHNNGPRDVTAMLTCDDVIVRGSGQVTARLHKHMSTPIQFNISLQEPQTMNEYLIENEWMNHTCTFIMKPRAVTTSSLTGTVPPIYCQFIIKSYLGRFLPHCDKERGKVILETIEVKESEGQVMLYFRHSPNDVITMYSYCSGDEHYNKDREEEMRENTLPLSPIGQQPSVLAMGFYPDCVNVSAIGDTYYITNCTLELYSICQEGVVLINTIKPSFDKEHIDCSPPVLAALSQVTNTLQLYLHIASVPLVVLLAIAVGQTGLGALLLTIMIIKACYLKWLIKKKRYNAIIGTDDSQGEDESEEERGKTKNTVTNKKDNKKSNNNKNKDTTKQNKKHSSSSLSLSTSTEESSSDSDSDSKYEKNNKPIKGGDKNKTTPTDKKTTPIDKKSTPTVKTLNSTNVLKGDKNKTTSTDKTKATPTDKNKTTPDKNKTTLIDKKTTPIDKGVAKSMNTVTKRNVKKNSESSLKSTTSSRKSAPPTKTTPTRPSAPPTKSATSHSKTTPPLSLVPPPPPPPPPLLGSRPRP